MTYVVGDTRERIADIPDGTVSLVATSPPFVALRSYLPADHPMKYAEIGSEPDPATFLDSLLALTAEWGRVLAPWGSIAVELGDTFAGSGGAGGDYNPGGTRVGQSQFDGSSRRVKASDHKYAGEWDNPGFGDGFKGGNPGGAGWPRPKCLALVPQAYALSLAYGRNILTGAESPAGQWLVRNVVVWHRPNPAVGALGDKYRPSTSYITVATRSPKRWFDLTAVRHPSEHLSPGGVNRGNITGTDERRREGGATSNMTGGNPAGAPPLDCWNDSHDTWTVTTQPSSLAHYAMWPPRLAERLILSMCPAEVCQTCGEPRRRVERSERVVTQPQRASNAARSNDPGFGNQGHTTYATVGWTDCGHDNYRPGVVLDPFAGTGTTLAVAECHGRDSIGIDLDERNRALLEPRLAEVRRTLFGVRPEAPGQLSLLAGEAS